jgi:predicted TIM-barrel fold metal-dependent hydrolase
MFKVKLERELSPNSIVDCHTHAGGENLYGKMVGKEYPFVQSVCDLRFKQLSFGINDTVVFPMPSTLYFRYKKRGEKSIFSWEPSGLMEFPYQVENEALLEEIRIARVLYPSGHIFPFLNIAPLIEESLQINHLEKLMEKYGFFGLKFHSSATNASAEDLIDSLFIQFMNMHNIPIIVHSGYPNDKANPNHAVKLAQAHPDIRLSIAHLAGWDRDAFEIIKSIPNIYVDCSPFLANIVSVVSANYQRFVSPQKMEIHTINPIDILVLIFKLIPDQLIWGTDEPWTTYNYDTGSLIGKILYKDEIRVLEDMKRRGFRSIFDRITNLNPRKFLFGN